MESLAHAADDAYTQCCPIKSITLSNKDSKKPCIASEIKSNIIKKKKYFSLYYQNKITTDFYTHFRNFDNGQIIDNQRGIIMNINLML